MIIEPTLHGINNSSKSPLIDYTFTYTYNKTALLHVSHFGLAIHSLTHTFRKFSVGISAKGRTYEGHQIMLNLNQPIHIQF
jgi:hypothetical protein